MTKPVIITLDVTAETRKWAADLAIKVNESNAECFPKDVEHHNMLIVAALLVSAHADVHHLSVKTSAEVMRHLAETFNQEVAAVTAGLKGEESA